MHVARCLSQNLLQAFAFKMEPASINFEFFHRFICHLKSFINGKWNESIQNQFLFHSHFNISDFPYKMETFLPFLLLVFTPCILAAPKEPPPMQCNPDCTATSMAPTKGGMACMCTPKFHPPGCTIAPCRDGETSDGPYKCQCTKTNRPLDCVELLCTNETMAGNMRSHQSTYYYPSQDDDEDMPNDGCHNNVCSCMSSPDFGPGVQPFDCKKSKKPSPKKRACSCTQSYHRTACVLAPCKPEDTGANNYVCQCTEMFAPDFCVSPQCKPHKAYNYNYY